MVKDAIGDIDKERLKWTTPIYDSDDELNSTDLSDLLFIPTTARPDAKNIRRRPRSNFTVEDFKINKRVREVLRILNEPPLRLPNFDRGDDDLGLITRKFDQMRRDFRKRYERYRVEKVWRTRMITIMNHFIHATRYKLIHPQLLRKKYYEMNRYRIGYCFALLTHLKRQQLYIYTTLILFRKKVYFLHMHMRMYEKIVRLDVDIKDIIRMVKTLESRRRIEADPKYYDEFYEEPSTTTGRSTPGVQHVHVTAVTQGSADNARPGMPGHAKA
ncbi:uncharacterized protein LOC114360024 [Ostrinia furnacalis]|uniref:uncharacterized protein LOC114360024 n=1 Tax=Ostrinia furnacalis TaxID=93504 RepID=UPI00103AFD28|nr:uncharacterized protein LOC114360024 [Ostrinia furnacalis]